MGVKAAGGVGASPLLTNLVSYWKMDEVSDGSGAVSRLDSHGTNHLTDVNTTPSDPGKINLGAHMAIANSEYVSIANFPSLGNVPFTFAGWFYADAAVGNQSVLGMSSAGVWLRKESDTSCTLRMYDGSDHETFVNCLGAGNWNFFVLWYDPDADLQWIQINNGTPVSTANTGGVIESGTRSLYFGAHIGPGFFFGGLVDEVGFWNRILTEDERTSLYNGGAGLSYPF